MGLAFLKDALLSLCALSLSLKPLWSQKEKISFCRMLLALILSIKIIKNKLMGACSCFSVADEKKDGPYVPEDVV